MPTLCLVGWHTAYCTETTRTHQHNPAAQIQVWRCEVDIAAVARTCTDWPLLLAFLQRRQPALHPTCDIKALLLTIVKVSLPHLAVSGVAQDWLLVHMPESAQ